MSRCRASYSTVGKYNGIAVGYSPICTISCTLERSWGTRGVKVRVAHCIELSCLLDCRLVCLRHPSASSKEEYRQLLRRGHRDPSFHCLIGVVALGCEEALSPLAQQNPAGQLDSGAELPQSSTSAMQHMWSVPGQLCPWGPQGNPVPGPWAGWRMESGPHDTRSTKQAKQEEVMRRKRTSRFMTFPFISEWAQLRLMLPCLAEYDCNRCARASVELQQ